MQNLIKAWKTLNETEILDDNQCYRLPHANADIYGKVLWIYWYQNLPPSSDEQREIFEFAKSINKSVCIRHMLNRGAGVGGKESSSLICNDDLLTEWTAYEGPIRYVLKKNAGFSPGLFLDQRENRRWVLENAKSKKVLNLFSYTSGFSVAAALGNASEVTTVDVSGSFLEWSKENFKLNNLTPENYEFFAQDVPLFMAGAVKRQRQWDLIICDPPSFGRSKDSVWKIEKDLAGLASLLWKCLNPGGQILFTFNYEKWVWQDAVNIFTQHLNKKEYIIKPVPMGFLISLK